MEWIDRKIQEREIAERFFSKQESAYLLSLSPLERTRQFYSYWTCKEAFLKMQGEGITGGLDQCALSIHSDQSEVRLSPAHLENQREDYSLYRFEAGQEHTGAVAVACQSLQIFYWDWQDDFLL